MEGRSFLGVTDTLMKGSPDVDYALDADVRDGQFTACAVVAPRRVDLLADLDAAHVQGGLAHERDCLGFMMTAWPWPEGDWRSGEVFTTADILHQIDDVRACDPEGILSGVLNSIEAHVRLAGPTEQ